MTEEHFIRQWTDGHDRFSADLDRGLAKLRRIIGAAYGELIEETAEHERTTGQAMLAGLAATAVTILLFVSSVRVATRGVVLAWRPPPGGAEALTGTSPPA